MANAYTQIQIQAVFAVKNRLSLIDPIWEEKLYKYITGIIQNHGHKVLSIGGMPDHIHILFGFRPNQSLSELIQHVKRDSSAWINKEKFVFGKFSWQQGYGAFSYSQSQIPIVARYIENQKNHHRKKKFIDEYKKYLKDFDIEYNEQYIYQSISE
jgi:REP element-mobilizing transposase RayT